MHIKTILNRVQKHKGFVYGPEPAGRTGAARSWKSRSGRAAQPGDLLGLRPQGSGL